MAKRIVTVIQSTKSAISTTNGEGNEKTDNSSSLVADLQTYTTNDPVDSANPKIRGLAAGYREATRTK